MKRITLLLAIAIVFAFVSTTWAKPADPEDAGPKGPVPTYAPPAVPVATAAPKAEPTATCPSFTGNSSDFATFYVACNQSAATFYGPGGDATGGTIGEGAYSVDDRRCFAASTELNCEATNGGIQPNWFHTSSGWVTNGTQYSAPASAATPAPTTTNVIPPAPSGSFTYNVGYFSYLTSATGVETQSTPGTVSLSTGTGYVTWQVTENGRVIQGPTTFNIQAGSTGFNIYWQWPGMPVNEVSGLPDDSATRTIVMEATLYADDGTQLSVAPTISVSYQAETKLGPGTDDSSNHSDPRD